MSTFNQIKYSSNFKKIVTVEISHDYFNDSLCRSFEIQPDLSTKSTLANYGLLFKVIKNGFVLIASGDPRFKSSSFNGPVSLTFDLKNTDPYFLNYTHLSIDKNWGFKFENNSTHTRLHPNEFVDGQSLTPNEKMLTGQLKLKLNESNQFFGEEVKNTTTEEKRYSITFASREIFVRYNFYSLNKDFEFSDLYITDENNSLKLADIEQRTLSNGQEAYSIIRNEPVKLVQYFQEKFYLKKEDKFLNTFSVQLPHPELKNISFNTERNIFIAEVFISLD